MQANKLSQQELKEKYNNRKLVRLERWLKDGDGRPYCDQVIARERNQALKIVKSDPTWIIKEAPKDKRVVSNEYNMNKPEPEMPKEPIDSQANRVKSPAEIIIEIEMSESRSEIEQYKDHKSAKVQSAYAKRMKGFENA